MYAFVVFESLNHVVNEFLCHILLKLMTIIRFLHLYKLN